MSINCRILILLNGIQSFGLQTEFGAQQRKDKILSTTALFFGSFSTLVHHFKEKCTININKIFVEKVSVICVPESSP